MIITESMRQERLITRLEAEKKAEEERIRELDGINGMPEIVILRNKKVMHVAEIEQMIRKARYRMESARIREAINQHPAILQGGLGE